MGRWPSPSPRQFSPRHRRRRRRKHHHCSSSSWGACGRRRRTRTRRGRREWSSPNLPPALARTYVFPSMLTSPSFAHFSVALLCVLRVCFFIPSMCVCVVSQRLALQSCNSSNLSFEPTPLDTAVCVIMVAAEVVYVCLSVTITKTTTIGKYSRTPALYTGNTTYRSTAPCTA